MRLFTLAVAFMAVYLLGVFTARLAIQQVQLDKVYRQIDFVCGNYKNLAKQLGVRGR